MSGTTPNTLPGVLAARLRGERNALVARWLERIVARVQLAPNRVFATDDLLDHMPLLVEGIAAYLADPAESPLTSAGLVAKAMELGQMRHEQRFEAHEILKEYEILGSILFHSLTTYAEEAEVSASSAELLRCGHRLYRAIAMIQESTLAQYMRLARSEVAEREDRLRGFNRALSHEVRNRLGAVRGAVDMLGEDFIVHDEVKRAQFRGMAAQNLEGISRTMTNLIELSRMSEEVRQQQNVLLPHAVFESARQLRDFGQSRGVDVQIADDLPTIEVPASLVEIALTNYLTNAIKYYDPGKAERWVRVRGWEQRHPNTGSPEVVVAVSDNGLGVPLEARPRLFARFFRAHADSHAHVEGTGLGLSIVRETLESIGGRAWAELDHAGETTFAFALPSRRATDAGTARV